MLTMPPRVLRLVKNLLALLAGVVLALALSETVLLFVVPSPLHYRVPQPLHVPDDELGWRLTPDQRSFTIDQPVTTNRHGFRSDEMETAKSAGSLRILCVGDSRTFGIGDAPHPVFAVRLQRYLKELAPGRPVGFINGGVQAQDTHQEVHLLAREASRLGPDVVIVAFCLNDVGEALRTEYADSWTGTIAGSDAGAG